MENYFVIRKKKGGECEIFRTLRCHQDLQHDRTIHELIGMWGREDYAQIWCDFYNKKFDREELRRKLDKY